MAGQEAVLADSGDQGIAAAIDGELGARGHVLGGIVGGVGRGVGENGGGGELHGLSHRLQQGLRCGDTDEFRFNQGRVGKGQILIVNEDGLAGRNLEWLGPYISRLAVSHHVSREPHEVV